MFSTIIPDTADQAEVYEISMKDHISKFMQGHNICYMAYGQTGSGKTYTMIAPVGSFKKFGADDGGEILDHYGIFPRAAL